MANCPLADGVDTAVAGVTGVSSVTGESEEERKSEEELKSDQSSVLGISGFISVNWLVVAQKRKLLKMLP